MAKIRTNVWTVEKNKQTVLGAALETENNVSTPGLLIGQSFVTEENVHDLQAASQSFDAHPEDIGKVLSYKGAADKKMEWVPKSDIVSANPENATNELSSIAIEGVNYKLKAVEANPVGEEPTAEMATMKVDNTVYKFKSVEANPEGEATEDLTKMKIDNTIYGVSNPILNNAITNKGIGYVASEASHEYWDGNTTGKYSVTFEFGGDTITLYKISDATPDQNHVLSQLYPGSDIKFTIDESDIDDMSSKLGFGYWTAEKEINVFGNTYDFMILSIEKDFGLVKGTYYRLSDVDSEDMSTSIGGTVTLNDLTSYFISGSPKMISIDDESITVLTENYISVDVAKEGIDVDLSVVVENYMSSDIETYPMSLVLQMIGIEDGRGLDGYIRFWDMSPMTLFMVVTSPATPATGSEPELPTQTGFYTFKGITEFSDNAFIKYIDILTNYAKIDQNYLPAYPEPVITGYTGNITFSFNQNSSYAYVDLASANNSSDTILIYPADRNAKTAMDDNNLLITTDTTLSGTTVYLRFPTGESASSQFNVNCNYSIIKTIADPNN